MAQIIIIGAGLTGLSTAYFLEQQNFFDYIIYEQADQIGGLCKSVRSDGFTFDYTGHFFHGAHDIIDKISPVMKPIDWQTYVRQAFIWSHNTYTPYPYQTNLHGLPIDTIIDCISGFVTRSTTQSKNSSFEQWVLKNFGQGFAKHFFFPYQEKIFAYPVNKLRAGWVGLVPTTSLNDILQGALQPRESHQIGYNASFLYPHQGGIDHLIDSFSRALINKICTNSPVVSIDPQKKTVTLGSGLCEHYELLVNTTPLDNCLHSLGMSNVAKKLICNRIININFGINKPDITHKNWVYYPEPQYPFFRIGFPHTLHHMCPHGHSSISLEIARIGTVTQKEINILKKQTLSYLRNLFNFQPKDIVTEHILTLDHAYVIYDAWREKHLESLLAHLAEQSIISVGRYGAWKYASMHEAIREGQETANHILSCMSETKTYQPARMVQPQKQPIDPKQKKNRLPPTKELL